MMTYDALWPASTHTWPLVPTRTIASLAIAYSLASKLAVLVEGSAWPFGYSVNYQSAAYPTAVTFTTTADALASTPTTPASAKHRSVPDTTWPVKPLIPMRVSNARPGAINGICVRPVDVT